MLPVNFRSIGSSGAGPSGIGVPTNAGELRAHGARTVRQARPLHAGRQLHPRLLLERLAVRLQRPQRAGDRRRPPVSAGLRARSSPPRCRTSSAPAPRLRITPSLSYESGYPYGNGKKVYVFDPLTNRPVQVSNDDNVNPGASYYFLRDPSQPFDPATNPYVGLAGHRRRRRPELACAAGRRRWSTCTSRATSAPRLTAVADVSNLFGLSTPNALQSNPYLVGPPGDPRNGIPTSDGVHQSLPWTYGTGGYVPQSYPLARTAWLGLRYRF